MASLSSTWQSSKVIRTREKISFFFGVMSLLLTALLFGMAPQYVHALPSLSIHFDASLGGYTLHTRSRPFTSSRFARTPTRNAPFTISSLTCVTMPRFSISSSSGLPRQVRRSGLHATACRMALWLVLSLLGGIVSYSTTLIRLPRYSYICTVHCVLQFSGMVYLF